MRIDQLQIRNFKCFEDCHFNFNPQFNMFVGVNGSGKSSILDALAVATGSWFLGLSGCDTRHILNREARLKLFKHDGGGISEETQYPAAIKAFGIIQEKGLEWERTLDGVNGRTTSRHALDVKKLGKEVEQKVRRNENVVLPLVSYYGTGRLWLEPREVKKSRKNENSRFSGYYGGADYRVSYRDLITWLKKDAWDAYNTGDEKDTSMGRVIKKAILSCIEGADEISYDVKTDDIVVSIEGQGYQPFRNLSDGQRNMLALIGDLAIKAVKLNPDFDGDVLEKTPGIVLIDELDLHLHPKWQRRVVEDLRRTFPKVQFFATTHSPFIIQTLRAEELIVLDSKQPETDYLGKGVEEISQFIMGVELPELSPRFKEMIVVAKEYFHLLEKSNSNENTHRRDSLKKKLDEMTAPFSDNPAYIAFLEMKRHAAKVDE